MKVEITLTDQNSDNENLHDLKEWIHDEKIIGVKLETLTLPTREGKMGVDPSTLIAILSSVKAGFELVTSIIGWVKSRKENTTVNISVDEEEVEISSSNIRNEDEIIKESISLLENPAKKKK